MHAVQPSEAAMREDMDKVLVERPRSGRARVRALQGSRRQRRHRLDPDGESALQRLGMRRDAVDRKHFGEHLNPMYRYLRKQVDRPWDKVYGELCTQLDRRSVVQDHLFQHIKDRVAIDTVWRDGEVLVRRWNELVSLDRCGQELFVHPRTGILLPNREREIERRLERHERAERAARPHPDRRVGLPGMPAHCQWHRLAGLWYEVTLGTLDTANEDAAAYDVVLKKIVNRRHRNVLCERYGRADFYAIRKRQLGRAELRAHELQSGPN
jgi:hypothetical protein